MNRHPALLLACALVTTASAAPPALLVLERTIPLKDVNGRVDHLRAGPRVFVAELGNRSVELIDGTSGRSLGRIPGLGEPQGVWDLPEFGKLAVACTDDGTLHWFDGKTLAPLAQVKLGEDADNVRYDEAGKRLWVGYGEEGRAGLAAFDPATGKKTGEIPLPAHPESFQLEASGSRVFANVPNARKIVVADRSTLAVTAEWRLREEANFPMALDDGRHRVLVVTRRPARFLVFAMADGRRLADLPCIGDADDVWWDAPRSLAYVSGGAGAIAVFRLTDDRVYRALPYLKTAPGARTSAWDPATDRLFLAVPHRGAQPAALWVFRPGE